MASSPTLHSQSCPCLQAGSASELFALKTTPGLRVLAWLSRLSGLEPRAIFILPPHSARGLGKTKRSWSFPILEAWSPAAADPENILHFPGASLFLPDGTGAAALLCAGSGWDWMGARER